MKINNTVRTASVNSASKTSNSKTTSAAKSSKATSSKTTSTAKSSKATSAKTTSTAKSSSKTTNAKTTSTAKSSSKTTSAKTTSTSKNSTKTSNSKSSTASKTGTQASSNKALGNSKNNTKTSIASTIASMVTSSAKSMVNSSSKENSNLTSLNSSSITGSVTKYIVDAPAIYTSQARKSTIGKNTSSLGKQSGKDYVPGMPSDVYQKANQKKQTMKDYRPGMPSDVYNKTKETNKPKYNGKTSDINKMLSNLDKDKTLKLTADHKKAMLYAGEKMLNAGYDEKFVAGVLGNIMHEGVPGQFEKSNYSSHPEMKPDYLEYMDKDFAYTKKYSGKNISEVGIKETVKLQKEASKKKHFEKDNGKQIVIQDKFGLGMFQFTGARTSDVLDAYQTFYDRTKENNPTKEQCLEIEINFTLKELKSETYRGIYESWKKGDKTAYSAGDKFCKEYEKPINKDIRGIERGNDAEKIYKVMKKQ